MTTVYLTPERHDAWHVGGWPARDVEETILEERERAHITMPTVVLDVEGQAVCCGMVEGVMVCSITTRSQPSQASGSGGGRVARPCAGHAAPLSTRGAEPLRWQSEPLSVKDSSPTRPIHRRARPLCLGTGA